MFVPIGGIEQWVQVGDGLAGAGVGAAAGTARAGAGGASRRPVLLYLHGGPGGTSVPAAAAWRPWDEYFTVVHWDQRGAGRTFGRNGAEGCGPLTLDLMVRDGLEVVEYLLGALQPASGRVVLVGHSWGTALGVHMLKRRPELFSAYVGTAQLVNMRENEDYNYRWTLRRAELLGNTEALEAVRALGAPPFSEWKSLQTLREWSDRLAEGDGDALLPRPTPMPAGFTAADMPPILAGAEFTRRQLLGELYTIDLPALGLEFEVPMFFFHGTCDHYTPVELAERYFARISAPHKEFVQFAGCHHFVVMNRPGDFLRELVARVLPRV
jgi:pimeloyl-ACP methyl ester carboxylesterase